MANALRELGRYIRECWTEAISFRERQSSKVRLLAGLIAFPVVVALGGKPELTERGVFLGAGWLTLSALLYVFFIAPFLIWQRGAPQVTDSQLENSPRPDISLIGPRVTRRMEKLQILLPWKNVGGPCVSLEQWLFRIVDGKAKPIAHDKISRYLRSGEDGFWELDLELAETQGEMTALYCWKALSIDGLATRYAEFMRLSAVTSGKLDPNLFAATEQQREEILAIFGKIVIGGAFVSDYAGKCPATGKDDLQTSSV